MIRLDMTPNLTFIRIMESWATTDNPMNSTEELLEWIRKRNEEVNVTINKIEFEEDGFWYYDKEEKGIVNRSHSFFQVKGLVCENEGEREEQPIIIQDEIGYLGIIAKEIDGVLYFLMQAKIEPGNVNKVQLSPTIQATKSNFMQVHGGKAPAYLNYFSKKKDYEIIVDQIQSEQSSRFYGKRNRNIIIVVDDEIEVLESHKWMTLGQIKELMRYDNLVNMDTRTVISCIPVAFKDFTYKELTYIKTLFTQEEFFNSMFFGEGGKQINKIYQYMNEIKMLDKREIKIVDLYSLDSWNKTKTEISSPQGEFKVIYCDIEIEGREVKRWQQPLFEAVGESVFGLMYCVKNNRIEFLIQTIAEVGCFDKIEIGPSVQLGANCQERNVVTKLFYDKMEKKEGIIFTGVFSEEGGRFYHEQNRNVLMEVKEEELQEIPEGFFWVDYQTLNILIQFNNCLNIQLRNLLSILRL